ncbi:MAG: chain-length determining protein [Bacteroidales bacterium]|nr:chain-length determining protein [Bacteroidales bacterium]MDE6084462.1 chain-length determining protein [Muribaculaceae bacterium]
MIEENNKSMMEDEEGPEINLLELGEKLWAQKKKIAIWSLIGAVVGLIIAFSIPKEYTAVVKVAPETNSSKISSGLGALASMAGISSQSNSSDAVYPDLYPDVVNSLPFITGLFNVEVETRENGRKTTVVNYMQHDIKTPWWVYLKNIPIKIIALFRSKEKIGPDHKLNTFRLTKGESKLVGKLRSRISTVVDKKTDVITVSVRMQDGVVAAMLADTVVNRLQDYITEYRTNKARQDLEFALKLNEEAKENYYKAQQKYADYLDHNQFVVYHSAQIERDRLENEATLTFNLYNQTSQQVQRAQALVQETTPVYVIVEPSTAPVASTSPKRAYILVGFTFVGFALCSLWILYGKPMWVKFIESRRKGKDA